MSDLKNTVIGITKNITKSSSSIVKTTQLSMKLSSEEENLKTIYMEIGRKVHEIYSYGGSLGEFFDEKYAQISAAEAKIADSKKALEVAKGTRPCPKCGKSVERNVTFCPTCGHNVNELKTEREYAFKKPEINDISEKSYEIETPPNTEEPHNIEKPQIIVEEIQAKICHVCGDENEISEKFCLNCGRLL